ncbi:glycoside hydrolase family 13 protein [Parablautia sp. Marseille-Q6255]|uniref:glycoside hydrolase family 13 protein n=1 Tax=Parablautia sp. Marseille-Q6255 TaxID=3039593 RepID=UPI0024BC8BF4|nr:alpha-glucosidase [Parablautia sp. Marseille-Q6255]
MKRKWWHDKVAYQIYPKSFYDTNADGIGDLRGIIEKLDYLADLGIEILWLSPVYLSPFADQGYDIADYYQIDPRFGTMEDMDELIAEAKKRGISILMDLVVNHCSDEHIWFQKAIADPDGPYGKYFYLEKDDGQLPCNWRSYFGGPCWDRLPGTDRLYLHVFHKKQPDLNWENPEVRNEIYKNINWWLEKGLGGFRIDAIINIKKALPFHDYPADRADGLSSIDNMLEEASGIGVFLQEMRQQTFEKYDAFTVGEVFHSKAEELSSFIGEDGFFSTMFDFRPVCFSSSANGFYDYRPITPEDYKQCIFTSQAEAQEIGFYANVIENHDGPRGASHYLPADGCHDTGKKMLATISLMLRGIPFIYQGQELGMENTVFSSIEDIDDINTLAEYETAKKAGLSDQEALSAVSKYSRDNARTPMQWTNGAQAGFTQGTPWLPVNPNYTAINAASQLADENSVLSYYKKLIALRRDSRYKETLVYGKTVPFLAGQKNLTAFLRQSDQQNILVLANYQSAPQEAALPFKRFRTLLSNYPDTVFDPKKECLTLRSYEAKILLEL